VVYPWMRKIHVAGAGRFCKIVLVFRKGL